MSLKPGIRCVILAFFWPDFLAALLILEADRISVPSVVQRTGGTSCSQPAVRLSHECLTCPKIWSPSSGSRTADPWVLSKCTFGPSRLLRHLWVLQDGAARFFIISSVASLVNKLLPASETVFCTERKVKLPFVILVSCYHADACSSVSWKSLVLRSFGLCWAKQDGSQCVALQTGSESRSNSV